MNMLALREQYETDAEAETEEIADRLTWHLDSNRVDEMLMDLTAEVTDGDQDPCDFTHITREVLTDALVDRSEATHELTSAVRRLKVAESLLQTGATPAQIDDARVELLCALQDIGKVTRVLGIYVWGV